MSRAADKSGQDRDGRGFLRDLQSYGDRDFSVYMRRAFAKSMGLATSDEVRDLRRVVSSLEQSVSRLRAKLEKDAS